MTIILAILWAIWSRVKLIGYFVFDNWKVTLPIIIVLAGVILFYRNCGPKPAKLNEVEIQAAQVAIEARDTKKLKEILAAADVREANIDANVANAATQKLNALAESRDRYDKMTADELAAELEKRK